jgi:hypothetical protein
MTERDTGNAPLERDAVSARAYALYVRRGMKPGRDLDDWLEAERQLRGEAVGAALAKASGAATPAAPAAPAASAKPPAPSPKPAPASPAEAPAAGVPQKPGKKRKR